MNDGIHLQNQVWVADQGDGTYRNPILYADYSDPDAIRVGEDFYMVASSFNHLPGLPLLHSRDLVNWTILNHALPTMPLLGYDQPQHGKGVWAPALRYHDGKFWIFYGDPDVGIFVTTATDPAGEWSALHLVEAGKGLIDPCPFWDEDGQAYLVHAYARSRSGIKHILRICPMAADGTHLLGEGQIVFDGTEHHPTTEGPKLYKRNGYYYIFAPAGGVATGWQLILRSKSIYGPYEEKVVLHQGDTDINGPHQGALIELASGESWFLHFQDKGAYGRIVHLQPVEWVEDWPLMGVDRNKDGVGEPVEQYRKPDVGASYPIAAPVESDDFSTSSLGLQWQWQANPQADWYSLEAHPGYLRLFAQSLPVAGQGLYDVPNLLMQKFPAPAFGATVNLELGGLQSGNRVGLIVFGRKYAALSVEAAQDGGGMSLVYTEGEAGHERELWRIALMHEEVDLALHVDEPATCRFAYQMGDDEPQFVEVPPFVAEASEWTGAKVGVFAVSASEQKGGYVDIDWFVIGE